MIQSRRFIGWFLVALVCVALVAVLRLWAGGWDFSGTHPFDAIAGGASIIGAILTLLLYHLAISFKQDRWYLRTVAHRQMEQLNAGSSELSSQLSNKSFGVATIEPCSRLQAISERLAKRTFLPKDSKALADLTTALLEAKKKGYADDKSVRAVYQASVYLRIHLEQAIDEDENDL